MDGKTAFEVMVCSWMCEKKLDNEKKGNVTEIHERAKNVNCQQNGMKEEGKL